MKKIAVIGSINQDIIANMPHIPAVGETILASYGGEGQGGKGGNQAGAIAKLGGDVVMLGAVGQDAAGESLLCALTQAGVNTAHIKWVPDVPSGQAWIMVNAQGDNAIVVLPGANSRVDLPYIESVRPVFEAVDIVVMQMEIPLQTVCSAANLAKQLGKAVVLDPAPAVKNLPDELLQSVDYIKPNESELEILTGCGTGQYREGAQQLLSRGVGTVIVSLGERGIYCCSKDGEFERPARKVKAVDTTAAGDSFLAALVLGLAQSKSLEDAAHFAQLVSSIVVTRPGAQSSIPTAAELAAL